MFSSHFSGVYELWHIAIKYDQIINCWLTFLPLPERSKNIHNVDLSFPQPPSLLETQANQWCYSLLRVFVLTVVFGLFHGLGLLPVLLAHFGPAWEEPTGSLACLPSPASSTSSASTSSSSIPTSLSSDSLPTVSAQKQWDVHWTYKPTIYFDVSSLTNAPLANVNIHLFQVSYR